jgi:hypothetical protein
MSKLQRCVDTAFETSIDPKDVQYLVAQCKTYHCARDALHHLVEKGKATLPMDTLQDLVEHALETDNCIWAIYAPQVSQCTALRDAVLQFLARKGRFHTLARHTVPPHRTLYDVYQKEAEGAIRAHDTQRAAVAMELCAAHSPPVVLDPQTLLLALARPEMAFDALLLLCNTGCPMHVPLATHLLHMQVSGIGDGIFVPLLNNPRFTQIVRDFMPHRMPHVCYLALPPSEVPQEHFDFIVHMYESHDAFDGKHFAWQHEAIRRGGWINVTGGNFAIWHESSLATLYWLWHNGGVPWNINNGVPKGPQAYHALRRVMRDFPVECAWASDAIGRELRRLRAHDSRGARLACRGGARLVVSDELWQLIQMYI